MKKLGKMISFAGAMAALSGIALLLNQMIRQKDYEEWSEPATDEDDVNIEISMSAGNMDFEEGDLSEAVDEEVCVEEPVEPEKLEVVAVLPTGPRTVRVRPTEEEEKEMLRKRLENTIRF